MTFDDPRLHDHPALLWSLGLALLVLIFMWPALFPPPGMGLAGHDLQAQLVPWRHLVRERILEGDLPLWNPYIFAGTPSLANPQVAFFYPLSWLAMLPRAEVALAWFVALHIWLAGVGMLRFTRHRGSSWSGAGLAAIAFAFSGFTGARLWAGHYYVFAMIALLPWLLLAYSWSVRRGDAWSGLAAGALFALIILCGHLPTLVYVTLIWGIFVLYLIIAGEADTLPPSMSQRAWRVIRQAALVAVSGVALAAVILLPALQFISRTVRTTGFAEIIGSLPPFALITLAIPRFLGTVYIDAPLRYVPSLDLAGWHEMVAYTGILPLLGVALSLRRPTKHTWLYLSMIGVGLVLALGVYTPIAPLAYRVIPIFSLIRVAARATVLYVFASCALLADAITHSRPGAEVAARRRFTGFMRVLATGGVLLLALLAVLLIRMMVDRIDSHAFIQGLIINALVGWAFAAILILFGSGLLWALFITPPLHTRRATLLTGALALLLLGDLWSFSRPGTRLTPFGPPSIWVDAEQRIPDDGFRFIGQNIDLLMQTRSQEVHLYNVYGYDPLILQETHALHQMIRKEHYAVLDLLSVRYVVILEAESEPRSTFELLWEPPTQGDLRIIQRERALPLARLVYDVQIAPPPDEEPTMTYLSGLDPARTVTLEADPGCALGPPPTSPGEATISAHEPEYWRIETRSDAPAILVVAEADYPGWQVTVDGAPAESMRAYGAIRAVCVPAGDHIVEWRFRPRIFMVSGAISGIALVLLGIAIWRVSRSPV